MQKNCKKLNQNEFRIEKVIKRKGDKLYRNSPVFFLKLL